MRKVDTLSEREILALARPSWPLTATVIAIVALGRAGRQSQPAAKLGFTPLPGSYFLFLAAATATYLLLVEWAKRRLFRT